MQSVDWSFPVRPLRWQNRKAAVELSRDNGVLLRWDNAGYKEGDRAIFSLSSRVGESLEEVSISCEVDAWVGQLLVGSDLMRQLPAEVKGLTGDIRLGIRQVPEFRMGTLKTGQTFRALIQPTSSESRYVVMP